jgi:glycolate oxidase iron-sulfur subunit
MTRTVAGTMPAATSMPGGRTLRPGHVEAILVTASGCGVQVKDYGHMLRDDPAYAGKAARVAAHGPRPGRGLGCRGGGTAGHPGPLRRPPHRSGRSPFTRLAACSMARRSAVSWRLFWAPPAMTLTPVADAHLCCGSAGTYSLLQPSLSLQLRANKLAALEVGRPERIVSANIGCIEHLCGAGSSLPVQHWIELIDEKITKSGLKGKGCPSV